MTVSAKAHAASKMASQRRAALPRLDLGSTPAPGVVGCASQPTSGMTAFSARARKTAPEAGALPILFRPQYDRALHPAAHAIAGIQNTHNGVASDCQRAM